MCQKATERQGDLQYSNFRFLNGIFQPVYFQDQPKRTLSLETEQYCTHMYKQPYLNRYRLETYVATYSRHRTFSKSSVVNVYRLFQADYDTVYMPRALPAAKVLKYWFFML